MDSDADFVYEFPPGLSVSGLTPGTNVLVSGPPGSGARSVALDLVTASSQREGVLLVSADVEGQALLDHLDDVGPPVTRSMLGIVDCTGSAPSTDRRFTAHAAPISDPGDLTNIEIEFSLLYEKLADGDPRGVRIGFFSLSSVLDHASYRDVARFLHMLSGRIIATGDLGVFVVDSSAQDDRTIETMRRFCDGHVEVRARDGGGVELRVGGLDDQPETWTPVDYDLPMDALEDASETAPEDASTGPT